VSHLLLKAAEKGDIKKLEERLAAGDDMEYRDKGTGRTALLYAVIEGHKEAVLYLLDKGADINAYCRAVGHNSLEWAVEEENHELAKLLTNKGADPNFRSENSFLGRSPLIIRDSYKM
jgi:ankyrin repeat protein